MTTPIDGGAESLLPFRPGEDGAWDEAAAAHLARRAAFGAPPPLVARLLAMGPQAAAAWLLEPCERDDDLDLLGSAAGRAGSLESCQGWWVYRMLLGKEPAREKLALFWHGHFATSNRKVEKPRLLKQQIELFQRSGAGPFAEFLLAVARDPAMLIWLDGNANRRGQPNENFARELLELFALGIGNYGETDIQEAARAFTGWHLQEGEFWLNERAHDSGMKRLFGREGRFGGEDVIRLCLEQPACARHVARKLFEFYVHPQPGPRLVRALGDEYEACGKHTGRFLVRLWGSRIFHSSAVRRSLVAPPADYAIGSLATLEGTAGAIELARRIGTMGQDLLQPPSVRGWEGGMGWLNTTTLLARYRFAVEVTAWELHARLPWESLEREEPERLIRRFFPERLAREVEADLLAAAGGDRKLLVAGCLQLPEAQFL